MKIHHTLINPKQHNSLFISVSCHVFQFHCMLSSIIGKMIKADNVWMVKGTEENTLLATLQNKMMCF